MQTIGELLTRDLSRKIEEITQVDQTDDDSVYEEITEYVATDSIRKHYASLLRAIAEAPAEPHEGIGVWISGFFGSGKSSFAKNLGYAVQNRQVRGCDFASLFKTQIEDQQVSDLLDLVNARAPTDVVLFDVSKQNDIRTVTERLAEKIYTVVLRELGYAEDFEIAELEIELESEENLDEFIRICRDLHEREWRIVRKGAQKFSRASAILHELDPRTYPSAESWAHAQGQKVSSISVSRVVERTFELMNRRRPGTALMLVIDEVGQHVARSGDKIEDLRATVEEFGKVGKNLLKARKIVAPCWIMVTSQEKLDEVVAAIDSKRVDLAKLQDRFRHRVDLAPSDIREVATKRVLAKTLEAEPVLRKLFSKNQGSLNASLRLERTARTTEIIEADFVQFYPYPPHYVDLCIGIMSGIRLQPGAPKHYGGSNRTIIKQAYEMLVNERTAVAKKPVGTLVTLDKVYELVEGNLSSEKQRDIHDIGQRIKDPEDGGWSVRVAKVVCLLEFVRDLPRTEKNLAALLVDQVGGETPLAEVSAAVKRLHDAQFLRRTDEGWKLQTAQEKSWDTERRNSLDPKPRERNEIIRNAVGEVFGEPALKTYRHGNRTFRIGLSVDSADLLDGEVVLSMRTAEDDEEFPKLLDEVRADSRQAAHADDLYWVYSLTSAIDHLVAEVYASKSMLEKYRRRRADHNITAEEAKCLQDEEATAHAVQSRLRDKLAEAIGGGQGMFRGVGGDASSFGNGIGEIIRKFLGNVIPDLYPKLEMGTRPLKGNEAEVLLKATDLRALPSVFYGGEDGLGLVVEDGGKFVANASADVAAEVLDHLLGEHSYGNRDSLSGKALLKKFGGIGYGWDGDVLRLILAILFRAGAIEVNSGGQKFDSPIEPRSREPFTNNTKFKSAQFTPVKPVDLQTLKRAVETYENLTGGSLEMERNAIADGVRVFAEQELRRLTPIEVQVQSLRLPVSDTLRQYRELLDSFGEVSADDCVTAFAGSGTTLKEAKTVLRRLTEGLDDRGVFTVRLARNAVDRLWPLLEPRGYDELAERVESLREMLDSEHFYESFQKIRESAEAIRSVYGKAYEEPHGQRSQRYGEAVEKLKGYGDWAQVPDSMRTSVLRPLTDRICGEFDLGDEAYECRTCRASLGELEADLAACGGRTAQAAAEIQKLTTPPDVKIQRVRIAEFFSESVDDAEGVKRAVDRLQDHLLKLLDEGVRIVVE